MADYTPCTACHGSGLVPLGQPPSLADAVDSIVQALGQPPISASDRAAYADAEDILASLS